MKKLNLLTILFILTSFISVQAVEVGFSGSIDADVGFTTDKPGKEIDYYETNQEIDLTMDAVINEKISIQFYTTVLTGATPLGAGAPGARWGNVGFDGITLTWKTNNLDWYFIDLVYQGGSFDHYRYNHTSVYSTIIPETFIRGVGFDHVQGLSVYSGLTDGPARVGRDSIVTPKWASYISYEFQVGVFTFKPMFDIAFGGDTPGNLEEKNFVDYHGGTSIALHIINLQANLDLGAGKEYGEPLYLAGTLSGGIDLNEKFSISGMFHYNSLKRSVYTFLPEQTFGVITPTIKVCEMFDLALNLEYHNLYDKDIKDTSKDRKDVFSIVPALHINPIENVLLIPRVGFNFGGVDKEEKDRAFVSQYFANIELVASF